MTDDSNEWRAVLNEWLDGVGEAAGGREDQALFTGFYDLDMRLGGLRPGHLMTVTGATGVGSSTLLLNVAAYVAVRLGKPVHILSLESPRRDVLDRLVAAQAGVPLTAIRQSHLNEGDWTRIAQAMPMVLDAPIVINDRQPQSVDALIAQLTDQPPALLVIDGAQLLAKAPEANFLWAAHYGVAGDLKRAAMKLNIPVLITCSANRSLLGQRYPGFNVPRLGSVAAAAAYEAESDVVIGIHREDMADHDSPRLGEADLMILKSRCTGTATCGVAFQGHYARFVDLVAETPRPPDPHPDL